MKLQFKNYEGAKSTENLGTVNSVVGVGGSYRLIKNNFLSDKLVVLVIAKADGTSTTVTCGKDVSAALRSKALTMTQLGALVVNEVTTVETGEIAHYVNYPDGADTGSSTIKVTADSLKIKAPVTVSEWESAYAL